jgi:hypothetical protein
VSVPLPEFLFPLEWGGEEDYMSIQGLGRTTLVTMFFGEGMVSIWRTVVSFGERLAAGPPLFGRRLSL